MPKLYKVSFLIQTDEDPVNWICEAIDDQLEDGEKLLKYMSFETTLDEEIEPQETAMNRFKRYHRYFCRAIVAVVFLFLMAFVIWGIFEYQDVRLAFGLITGLLVTIVIVCHIWITAFMEQEIT